MKKSKEYFEYITALLNTIYEAEENKIDEAIAMIVNAVKKKKSLFAFGASHAGIITEELFYRAGSFALVNPILEPSVMLNMRPVTFTSAMERLEGYGTAIADKIPLKQGDIVICHSVSGRNAIMLDFVIAAQKKGALIIAVTNVTYSKSVHSRHSSGKRLFELADIILDNHGEIGDASIAFDGLSQKVAPSSTIAGVAIVNSIICGVVEKLLEENIEPPILYSANIDGGDEKNKTIFELYKDNIFYL